MISSPTLLVHTGHGHGGGHGRVLVPDKVCVVGLSYPHRVCHEEGGGRGGTGGGRARRC